MLTATVCLIGLAATIVSLRTWRKLRGTTLSAPCAWAAASLALVTCAVGASAISGDPARANWAAHVDYLAGITTVSPFVALLGAKRPQDRAWQLIVAALVALLAFQDLRAWTTDGSLSPAPHAAWRWLTTGLSVMQLLNYLATRHAAAACLAFAGQVCLLGGNLLVVPVEFPQRMPCGLALVSTAVFVAAWCEREARRSGDHAHDIWLEFRDRYGALWALRVAERVNAVAAHQNSRFRLQWSGFRQEQFDTEQVENGPSPDADAIRKTLQTLLARFLRSA
ncbi:MAG TPA: hypothetical protein VG826_16875 [Pirellulales bacterium]|nr:hypothetical protein [Pirellulales bacterium]